MLWTIYSNLEKKQVLFVTVNLMRPNVSGSEKVLNPYFPIAQSVWGSLGIHPPHYNPLQWSRLLR